MGFAVALADTQEQSEPEASIEYMLARVASSDVVFLRNGKSHTATEAVDHMRVKYEYYEDRIVTPEDFIRWAATKSVLSGRAYKIRDENGEVPAAEWMHRLLAEYRESQNTLNAGAE
jgi:Family of unknown function (DUF5329)